MAGFFDQFQEGGDFYDPGIGASRALDSESWRGRLNLFNQFLAGQPAYGAMTDRGQYLQGRRFNPLSAQFQLGAANAPGFTNTQDFRGFLGTSPQVQGRDALLAQIEGARGLFPTGGFVPTKENIPEDVARTKLLGEATGGNIAIQAMLAGLNPFLQKTGQDVAERRLQAFRDQNTGMSLFEALLGGAFGAGVGPAAT